MTVFDSEGSDDNKEDGLFDEPAKQVKEPSDDEGLFDAPNYGRLDDKPDPEEDLFKVQDEIPDKPDDTDI